MQAAVRSIALQKFPRGNVYLYTRIHACTRWQNPGPSLLNIQTIPGILSVAPQRTTRLASARIAQRVSSNRLSYVSMLAVGNFARSTIIYFTFIRLFFWFDDSIRSLLWRLFLSVALRPFSLQDFARDIACICLPLTVAPLHTTQNLHFFFKKRCSSTYKIQEALLLPGLFFLQDFTRSIASTLPSVIVAPLHTIQNLHFFFFFGMCVCKA